MRFALATIVAAFAASMAFAADQVVVPKAADGALPAHAMRRAAPVDPVTDTPVIKGASVPVEHFAEWEVTNKQGTTVQIVWGKENVDKAPKNATRYTQKKFVFPTGQMRVLEFKKDQGGVLHEITVETGLMILKGSAEVGVNRKPVKLGLNDVVHYPSGILRSSGTPEDTTVLLWTVTAPQPNPKAAVVRASEAVVSSSAEWDVDGKRARFNKPEDLAKAPPDAIKLTVHRYNLPGNSVRLALQGKGGPTTPSGPGATENLIYSTSGHVKFYEDGVEYDVQPGDAVRETAGKRHWWNRIVDSSFIATTTLPVVPVKVPEER